MGADTEPAIGSWGVGHAALCQYNLTTGLGPAIASMLKVCTISQWAANRAFPAVTTSCPMNIRTQPGLDPNQEQNVEPVLLPSKSMAKLARRAQDWDLQTYASSQGSQFQVLPNLRKEGPSSQYPTSYTPRPH